MSNKSLEEKIEEANKPAAPAKKSTAKKAAPAKKAPTKKAAPKKTAPKDSGFAKWWDEVAVGLIRQGHSTRNILIRACEAGGGTYAHFVKEVYPEALDKHNNDLKLLAEEAFNCKK